MAYEMAGALDAPAISEVMAFVCCSTTAAVIERRRDKVKLKDVQVLTLQQGQYTAGRRSHPVPQLNCRGGSAGCRNQPSVVQCYNRGTDGQDVQWECKAEMKRSQKFGLLRVTCEGYDSPRDEYVLVGSCGPSLSVAVSSVIIFVVLCGRLALLDSAESPTWPSLSVAVSSVIIFVVLCGRLALLDSAESPTWVNLRLRSLLVLRR
nr:store-operated calcium entry-associated regulatory factor-like [Rhipicephalus microplus]